MRYLPQMASISDIKHEHLKVLGLLNKGPVVLASRNQPVRVLLSPEQWEKLLARIDEQQDIIILAVGIDEKVFRSLPRKKIIIYARAKYNVLESKLELAFGTDSLEILSDSEINEWLGVQEHVSA